MPQKFIGRDTNDYLEYFCSAVTIPSVRYTGMSIPGHSLMGITRITPQVPVFTNPLDITVIENSDFETYADFKQWFDRTGTGIDQQGLRNIKLRYYDDIVGDIELEKLEFPNSVATGGQAGAMKKPLKVKFLNAYIKALGPVTLSSEARDSFTTFQVQFNYEAYTTEFQ